jgi:hypothetical protein
MSQARAEYALRRDYAASSRSVPRRNRSSLSHADSCRLNYQSYLWRESLGYLIHPQIPKLAAGARIADVGTGTGYVQSICMQPRWLMKKDMAVPFGTGALAPRRPTGWLRCRPVAMPTERIPVVQRQRLFGGVERPGCAASPSGWEIRSGAHTAFSDQHQGQRPFQAD